MESFYRAGGIPAIMKELIKNKKIHTNIITVTGKTVGENLKKKIQIDRKVIKSFKDNLSEKAGFLIMKGNFFSSAVMKGMFTSVSNAELNSCLAFSAASFRRCKTILSLLKSIWCSS